MDISDISLDKFQREAINKWNDKELVIVAGPGAGKTTTLCHIVRHICHELIEKRILVLAYNVNAERLFTDRLESLNILVKNKKFLGDPSIKGCFVLTFDKYMFWARKREIEAQELFDFTSSDEHSSSDTSTTDMLHNYRMDFERALVYPIGGHEEWDWIIVDEAQDLRDVHIRLLDQLFPKATHKILAGDPRQEIYTGARYFSQKVGALPKDKITYLYYNHRSLPAIVELLNSFSRTHFPALHYDQIPSRTADGTGGGAIIKDPWATKNGAFPHRNAHDEGRMAGAILSAYPLKDVYIIGPISITKFQTEYVVDGFRQSIHESSPGAKIEVHFGQDEKREFGQTRALNSDACIVASACKLKGMERKCVVIIKPDIPHVYSSYGGVTRNDYLKKLFVSMSRAEDRLIFIPQEVEWLKKIIDSNDWPSKGAHIPRSLSVTDLAEFPCWEAQKEKISIDIPEMEKDTIKDSDFFGLWAEAQVALAMGLQLRFPLLRPAKINYLDNSLYEPLRIISEGPAFVAVYHPYAESEVGGAYNRLKRDFNSDPAYSFATLEFSIKTGREWTASKEFYGRSLVNASRYATIVMNLLEISSLGEYKVPVETGVYTHDGRFIGSIKGEKDFSTSGSYAKIVEMKVAKQQRGFYNQAGIYASMDGLASCFLLNLMQRSLEKVYAFPLEEINDVARAFLALKASAVITVNATKLRSITHLGIGVALSIRLVDEEGVKKQEIAGLAFTLGDATIHGRLHRKRNLNDPTFSQNDISGWLNSVSRQPYLLFWDKDSKELLENLSIFNDSCMESLILKNQFMAWYSQEFPNSSEINELAHATKIVLGDDVHFSSGIYEEAVMLGALYNGIFDHGGVC